MTDNNTHRVAGPFNQCSERDILHYRMMSVQLAKECFKDEVVSNSESLVGLAGIIWEFIEKGTTGPTATELAYAKALRTAQELAAAALNESHKPPEQQP